MRLILKSILEAIAGSFFSAIAEMIKDSFARQDQIDLGATRQRETDLKAENDKIAKADAAGDAVAAGGGVPIEQDPLNRRNRKR